MTRTHCRSCGDETDDGDQYWVCVTDGRSIPAPLVDPVVTDADWDAYYRDPETAPDTTYGSRIEPEYDPDDWCGPTDDDREEYMRESLAWPSLDDLLDEDVA